MTPAKKTLSPNAEPASKEQRLALIHHKLLPPHQVANATKTQASRLLRDYRKKQLVRKVSKTFLWILILAVLAGGGYFAWNHFAGKDFSESKPDIETAYFVETGNWAPWIQGETTLVFLSDLPSDLEKKLRTQDRLFRAILTDRNTPKTSVSEEDLEALKQNFPGGDDPRIRSSGATANKVGGTGDTAGVRLSVLRQYYSRFNQLNANSLSDQIAALETRINRDIAQLQGRSINAGSGPQGNESKATLRWMQNQLLPYAEKFKKLIPNDPESSALQSWQEFEKQEKTQIETQIGQLTLRSLAISPETSVLISEGTPVVLRTTVGSRTLYFLPGGDSEIQLQPVPGI